MNKKNNSSNKNKKDDTKNDNCPIAIPIAIVGMGCKFPKASGLNEYWANIKSGLDAICPIPDTHWKPQDYFDADKSAPDMTYAQSGGFIDPVDFDPLEFGITPNNLEATDTTQLLGMVAARDALRDAGYATSDDLHDGRAFDRDRCSAIVGVTGTLELVIPLGARLGHPHWKKALKDAGVDSETAADVVERISNSYVPWQENSFPGLLGNVAAGRIANRFNLGGTNCVVDAACASSLSALHLAMMELQTGRSDMAITGGIDSFNDIFMYMCFSKTPALSPTGHSRPFSANGDGTILGEGVGIVILKRLDDAQRDNDKIYAVITGIGSSSDGLGNAVYAPSAKGQAKALRNAYADAKISPSQIEMLEAHGTGTVVGDRIELEALTEVYREADAENTWCSVGSVKSMIGHTKAAAGVANIIKTAMALHNKVLPPSIKIDKPLDIIDPGTAPHYANTVKRPWVSPQDHKRCAALSSFGFGGSNFHCVLEEAQAVKTHIDWDDSVQILAWSADSHNELRAEMQKWEGDIQHPRIKAQILRSAFSTEKTCRLIIVSENPRTLGASITQALDQLSSKNDSSWSLPSGIYYGCTAASGDMAAVFPGQGSQRPGMLRDLSCQFPEMIAALDSANAAFGESCPQKRLSDAIYPIPVFDSESEKAQAIHLRQTNLTQPALGATSIGAWNILKRFALDPQHFAGHSFGEIPALCAAEYISEDDMHRIACTRGQLMAQGEGDRGSMLAVSAPLADIQKHIDQQKFDLVIANRNAPQQAILSGSSESVAEAQIYFKSIKIRSTQLPVAAAFHSRFVAEAEKPFHDSLKKVSFKASSAKCYANVSAKAYPKTSAKMKTLLSEQLVNPVQFVEQIQEMYKKGVRYFIECGSGNVLSNLIAKILPKDSYDTIHCISIDASKGAKNGIADLAKTLALTASLGYHCDLAQWDNTFSLAKVKPAKMSVPISGANHRSTFKETPPRAPRPSPALSTATATSVSAPVQIQAQPQPQLSSASAQIPNNALLESHQQSIMALQQMQEQTALLHQQYLQNQETSQQFINQLMQQNQSLLNGTTAVTMAPTATTITAPAIQSPASVITPSAPSPVQIAAPTPVTVAAASPVAASTSSNELSEHLMAVVSEKTGYPTEMLNAEMNLDADLGIDSIKRVEILSALQERIPDLPAIQAEDMGSIETLQDIINYCSSNETTAPVSTSVSVPTTDNAIQDTATQSAAISHSLMAIVAEKTGYPENMLQLDMDLDADLGIDSIKRVEILSALQEQHPDLPSVQAEDMGSLSSLQDIVAYLEKNMPAGTSAALGDTAPSTPAVSSNTAAATQAELMKVVSDKTGYPIDMLTPEMQLDSDLGIDSIKRVEILSALQEANPALPEISAEDLGSIHSLQDIIDACASVGPTDSADADTNTNTPDANQATSLIDVNALSETLLRIVAEKTGYPPEMLDIHMQLDSDLGVDSIKRVEILSALQEYLPDAPVVQAEDIGNLHTLADIIEHLQQATGSDSAAEILEEQAAPDSHACILRQPLCISSLGDCVINNEITSDMHCVILSDSHLSGDGDDYATKIAEKLSAQCTIITAGEIITLNTPNTLNTIPKIDILIICASHVQTTEDILKGFITLQSALPLLQQSVGRCICITQLGGQFALDDQVPLNVLSAAWLGMVKTASHEFPEVLCKIIDTDSDTSVDSIINELQNADLIEVALHAHKRWAPQLLDNQIIEHTHTTLFSEKDCVVISGGARGVTAEVAVALAKNFHLRLALLGRSPLPETEEAYLSNADDEAAVKKALISNWQGSAPTPKDIAGACAGILAHREIRNTLTRIQAYGSEVSYHSADVCDSTAINAVCENIRSTHGCITGIIHGAGILNDKLIVDKNTDEFAAVLATKVDGACNLLHACEHDKLKAIVFFSSSTARFGRTGQIDYAAANEILNKLAQRERNNRLHTKVLSINWGPWDGGMVTPALKKIFASEGVGVIDMQLGAQYLCDELNHEDSYTEIVILGDIDAHKDLGPAFPVHESAAEDLETHKVYDRELSVSSHAFLRSHAIGGKAVLPMAIIIEWLTHAAMHDNPGMIFFGLEDLRVFKGIIIDSDQSYPLSFHASTTQWNNGQAVLSVEVRSDGENNEVLHARARIHLTDSLETGTPSAQAQAHGAAPEGNPYQDKRLFHGPVLQGLHSIETCDHSGIVAWSKTAPDAGEWIQTPLRKQWYADPLALDVAFQAMIVWSHQQNGCPSLPTRIGGYQQFQNSFNNNGKAETCKIICRIISQTEHKACANIEFIDAQGNLIARILDYECVVDPSLSQSFSQNLLTQANA